jgi:hypothetical protein
MVKEDKIREMLRQNRNQHVLDEIAKLSFFTEVKLRKAYVTDTIASRIYPGKIDGISKTKSSIKLFCSPNYGILGENEDCIIVTEETLKYASRR